MIQGIFRNRELIAQLVKRDFVVRYRQSYLGYVWALLPQLVTVGIFGVLSSHRVFDMGDTPVPYVVYALWNVSVWQLFSNCIVSCTSSLSAAGSLVTKVNFSKEALVVASLGMPIFDFLIRLVPISIVFIWYEAVPTPGFILVPLVLCLLVLMAAGVGFYCSLINLVLRDIGNLVSMIMTFGIFSAPILYPPPSAFPFSLVNDLNPISPAIKAMQDLLWRGAVTEPVSLFVVALLSVLFFLSGLKFFQVALPRITERA